MDRLISEQAVLKQLKGCLTGGETEYKYVKLHIDSIPSAEPYTLQSDGTLVVDTPQYLDVKRVLVEHGTWCSGFYYQEGDEPEWVSITDEPKWIPVSERLPEDGEDVLFCDLFGHIMLGYHPRDWKSTHFAERGSWELQKNVAAWMPLPKPWKGEHDEADN